MMKQIKPAKQKFVRDTLNQAYNFFKHGVSDPDKSITFNPMISTFVIWESISLYFKLTGESNGLMKVFNGWFILNNKDVFTNEETKKVIEQLKEVNLDDRALFLSLVHQIDSKMST